MPRSTKATPEEHLDSHYRAIQARYLVRDELLRFGTLVTANGNGTRPVHRWFGFKEAFSARLVPELLTFYKLAPPSRFFDPFAGSGTSLISMIDLEGGPSSVVGLEINPFIATVARAKMAGALSNPALVQSVMEAFNAVLKMPTSSTTLETPSTTLNNRNYFSKRTVQQLLGISERVRSTTEGPVRDILLTCLGSVVEGSSRLRKDGRALRFVADKKPAPVLGEFKKAVSIALDDMNTYAEQPRREVQASVHIASATDDVLPSGPFGLSIFSPPYPNNIDYTEVYKLESWVTGTYVDEDAMKMQRLRSLRSHPSVKFAETYHLRDSIQGADFDSLVSPILDVIPPGKYALQRARTVLGYVDDMARTMTSLGRGLETGGHAFCIVANSKHGRDDASFEVASDLLIAKAGEFAGLEVIDITVARYPTRKKSTTGFLRESIVHFRKP